MSAYAQSELKRLGVPTRVEKLRAKNEVRRQAALERSRQRVIRAREREAKRQADRQAALNIGPPIYCDKCGQPKLNPPGKVGNGPVCWQCERPERYRIASEQTIKAALATVQGARAMRYGGAYITPTKTGTCIYCGHSADTQDHIIPRKYWPRIPRAKELGLIVEACRECNTHLGVAFHTTVSDRAKYLMGKYKVRRRYSQQRLRHLFVIANLGKLSL